MNHMILFYVNDPLSFTNNDGKISLRLCSILFYVFQSKKNFQLYYIEIMQACSASQKKWECYKKKEIQNLQTKGKHFFSGMKRNISGFFHFCFLKTFFLGYAKLYFSNPFENLSKFPSKVWKVFKKKGKKNNN